MEHKQVTRFIKYASVGGSTFALDLVLLYILIDMLGTHYLVASGLAFVCAVSVNYVVSRSFVFKGSKRSFEGGYINFIFIACVGLVLVVAGMYVLVDILAVPYLLGRVVIACITGFWNYLMNLFVNFKVNGVHIE